VIERGRYVKNVVEIRERGRERKMSPPSGSDVIGREEKYG